MPIFGARMVCDSGNYKHIKVIFSFHNHIFVFKSFGSKLFPRKGTGLSWRGKQIWESMKISAVQCFDCYFRWVSEKSRRKAALNELKELTKRGQLGYSYY